MTVVTKLSLVYGIGALGSTVARLAGQRPA